VSNILEWYGVVRFGFRGCMDTILMEKLYNDLTTILVNTN